MAKNGTKRTARAALIQLAANQADMKRVKLLKSHIGGSLSRLSNAEVVRYALKRAAQADQLEKSA